MHTNVTFIANRKRNGDSFTLFKLPILYLLVFFICSTSNLLSQEWEGVTVASGLNGSVMRPMSVGSYDLLANKTFIAFLGVDSHIYAASCDHNNNDTWSDPVKIADSPTATSAKYAYPQLAQTPDGYIHVFFAKHTTNIWYAKSANPHDISSWNVRDLTREAAEGSEDFVKMRPAYPKVLLGRDGFIYLFWRQSTDVDYIRHASYTYSKNSGETWEPAKFLITPIREDLINETYVGQINVEPRREGVPERFHFVYILAGGPEGHNQYHKNLYHAIWQPGDRNFYSLAGKNLGEVLDSPEMDGEDCLVYPTESSKTAIGYTHTVGINDKGEPIVDETWVYNGSEWVENAGGSQLDIDDSPSFLQWEDGRMLAYGDRFSLWQSFDMGDSWSRIAQASAPERNSGTGSRTIPISKPSHPSARVWAKEQNVNASTNYLTVFGCTSSKQPEKIILKSNYPSIPLGGTCTIQAFITDSLNARIMDATNEVSFTIEGNGTLSQVSAVAVNGLASIEFTAENTDEVVVIRAHANGLNADYTEVYVGNGLLSNPEPSDECNITIATADYSTETELLTVNFSTTGICSEVNATILNEQGEEIITLSSVTTGFTVNINEECSTCEDGVFEVQLSNTETSATRTFDYIAPGLLEILSVNPSTTTDVATVNYYSPAIVSITVSVLNSSDVEVMSLNSDASVGDQNQVEIDLSGELAGTYTISLNDGETTSTATVEKIDAQALEPLRIVSQSVNPVIDYFKVQFYSPESASVLVELLNADNNVVLSETVTAIEGEDNMADFDIQSLDPGDYTCRLDDGTTIITSDVFKQKITKVLEVLKSFPNPTRDLFAIELSSSGSMVISASVYNEFKELEMTENYSLVDGQNKIVIDFRSLQAGVYTVELSGNEEVVTIMVTKE